MGETAAAACFTRGMDTGLVNDMADDSVDDSVADLLDDTDAVSDVG